MPNKSFLRKQHFNPKKVDPQFGSPKMYISKRERGREREREREKEREALFL